MVKYLITDLERITGIKAHTIRIWEKRYSLLNPNRTDTNIRYYSDDELRRLLNISLLNKFGYRISSIVKMSDVEINERVLDITQNTSSYDSCVESLVIAMVELNEAKFEKALSNSILKLGFEKTVISVILPFLEKVGVLWQAGSINPAHEHFIANLIRQKLIVAIDSIVPVHSKNAKLFVLFLHSGELHELVLLFYHYILKQMGHKILYLGQSVPLSCLHSVCMAQKPDFLLTVITTAMLAERYVDFINELASMDLARNIFITGLQTKEHTTKLPANVVRLGSPSNLEEQLTAYLS